MCLLGWILLVCVGVLTAQEPKKSSYPAGIITELPLGEASPEPKFLKNIRQVTKGMVKAGEGYFSPDGTQIVYQAVPHDYPFYQIFLQPLAGGEPKRISTGRGRTTCSYFSPDGKKVLFASSHLDPKLTETEQAEIRQQAEDKAQGVHRRYKWDFDPHSELFELDLTTQKLSRLTDAPGYDAEGAYSRDGKQIAFCGTRDGDPDIYLMNADGSGVKQLTDAPGYDGGPFLSPDGKWVIFRSDRHKAEHLQLFVIGVDGQHETQLTNTNGVHWGPYWHPSQPYVIWSGADHSDPTKRPNYDLWLAKYTINSNGDFSLSHPQRVTDFAGADVLPVFSPDGKQLLWTSTRTEDRSSQLFLADFALPSP
jgi:Tol biopolymer transport system component